MVVIGSDEGEKEELYIKRGNIWRKLKDFS